MDANGVLTSVFDPANGGQLATTAVAGTSTSSGAGQHDANWIWSKVYDRATNTIRVILHG